MWDTRHNDKHKLIQQFGKNPKKHFLQTINDSNNCAFQKTKTKRVGEGNSNGQ